MCQGWIHGEGGLYGYSGMARMVPFSIITLRAGKDYVFFPFRFACHILHPGGAVPKHMGGMQVQLTTQVVKRISPQLTLESHRNLGTRKLGGFLVFERLCYVSLQG